MKKADKKGKADIREDILTIIVLITAFAVPTACIAYPLIKFMQVNSIVATMLGLACTGLLVVALGWHKPAYKNDKVSKKKK